MRVEDLTHTGETAVGAAAPEYPEESDVATNQLLRVTDRYGESLSSGPLGIERTYLEWKLADAGGEIAGPEGVGALLADCTVRFDRAPGESWRRAAVTLSERARGEAIALEKLAPELDFAALLPEGDVSPGATWEVPLERVDSLLTPGLDAVRVLGLDTTSLLASLGELPPGVHAPSLLCTYASNDRVDEHDVATIRLSIAVTAAVSPSPAARKELARQISGGASLTVESFTHELRSGPPALGPRHHHPAPRRRPDRVGSDARHRTRPGRSRLASAIWVEIRRARPRKRLAPGDQATGPAHDGPDAMKAS
jgi:hypothetical protein